MAVVVVAFDGVRVNSAESVIGWAKVGSGGNPTADPDFVFQGIAAVSSKVGAGGGGLDFADASTNDMTVADRKIWMAKVMASNKSVLLANGAPAMTLLVGSSAADHYEIDVHGNDDYPLLGGWIMFPLDVNLAAYRSVTTGTPLLTAVDYYALLADYSAPSKVENTIMDAIDIGRGLTLVGGDGVDPNGSFQSFSDADEGQATTGRWGFFVLVNQAFQISGMHWIGQNAAGTSIVTSFTDTNSTLFFPEGLVGAGSTGLSFNLATASTSIDIDNLTMTGVGRKGFMYLDTRTIANGGYVDDATDEIRFANIHKFTHGTYVSYDKINGTAAIGLTAGNNYWVRVVDASTITLHTVSRRDVFNNTNRVNLIGTAAGVGDQHILRMVEDSSTDIFCTGTAGISMKVDGSTFNNLGTVTMTSLVDFEGCVFAEVRKIVQGLGRISNCTVSTTGLEPGESLMVVNDANDLDNILWDNKISATVFSTAGPWGHILEFDTIGTYNLFGHKFLVNTNQATGGILSTEFDINATTDVITMAERPRFNDGEPVFYNKNSGTQNIGLTEGTLYWIELITSRTFALYLSQYDALAVQNRVSLTASTVGNNEDHSLHSGNTEIYNSSGGLVTINLSGGGDTLVAVRNGPGSSTVIGSSFDIDLDITDSVGAQIQGAAISVYSNIGDLMTEGWSNNFGGFVASGVPVAASEFYTIKIRANSDRVLTDNIPGIRYLPANVIIRELGGLITGTISLSADAAGNPVVGNIESSRVLRTGIMNSEFTDTSGVDLPIFIPNKGTSRKLIFYQILWDNDPLNVWSVVATNLQVNGNNATRLQSIVTNYETTEDFMAQLVYYDIPDGVNGWVTVHSSLSGGFLVGARSMAWIILDDMAPGAPEGSVLEVQDNAAGEPSVSLNNTTANAISLHFFSMNKILTTPIAGSGSFIEKSDRIPISTDVQFINLASGGGPRGRTTINIKQRTVSGVHTVDATVTGTKSFIEAGATFAKN